MFISNDFSLEDQMPTSTDLPSPDPTPRLSDPATLREMGAALPLVIKMLDEWTLKRSDQAALLGLSVRSLQRGLNGRLPLLDRDQVTRLSLITGIYRALQLRFPPESAARWFKHPQHGAPFHDQTPLAYARETGIPGLYAIRRLLDAAAHGNFTTSPGDRRYANSFPQPPIDLSDPEAPNPERPNA